MKSLGVVALGLVCVALFVYAIKSVLSTAREWDAFEQDTATLFTAIEVERIVRDSTQPLKDSLEGVAKRGRTLAIREREAGNTLRRQSDSLVGLLTTAQTAQESLYVTAGALETLEVGYDSLSGAFDRLEASYEAQSLALGYHKSESARAWALLDSASSVIRRVPSPCRVPLVGIRCPVPVLGVGVTVDGPRVFAGVGIPLR